MIIEEKIEEKIHRTEKTLKELLRRCQRFEEEYSEILQELSPPPEGLEAFASNPENFPPATWEELQKEKNLIDMRLNLEMSNIRDANKAKQTTKERGQVQQHWLFVR